MKNTISSIEEHPRYTFHYEAKIGSQGRLSIRDHNYSSSEGTSRLAVRGLGGIRIDGDDLPTVVDQIPARPVWQLSDEEERRTKQLRSASRPRPSRTWPLRTIATPVRAWHL